MVNLTQDELVAAVALLVDYQAKSDGMDDFVNTLGVKRAMLMLKVGSAVASLSDDELNAMIDVAEETAVASYIQGSPAEGASDV